MPKRIIVIGGGIVGITTALELQRRRNSVTIIDPKKPGRETSYGNSGVLSDGSVVISNNPGLRKKLPKLILKKSNALNYNIGFILKSLPWVSKFLSYCTDLHLDHSSRALRSLQSFSLSLHLDLIREANADSLLRKTGWLKVFRSDSSFKSYDMELRVLKKTGVGHTILNSEQLRNLEPSLNQIFKHGVLLHNACSVSSPSGLCDAYLSIFEKLGGKVLQAAATTLSYSDGWKVEMKNNQIQEANQVVIAAGPWSAEIAGKLGYKIPMGWERGYHIHLNPGLGASLQRVVHDVDRGYVMAPQQKGVRITSGVEINGRDAKADEKQIRNSIHSAREALPLGAELEDSAWMGRRPTLVDSLPIIDKGSRHDELWFNFGHQHNGLSTSAGSAMILADLMHGVTPSIDPSPFRADRFKI